MFQVNDTVICISTDKRGYNLLSGSFMDLEINRLYDVERVDVCKGFTLLWFYGVQGGFNSSLFRKV